MTPSLFDARDTSGVRHLCSWPLRATMDALSRLIFRVNPAAAGTFDAWCDSHGRWTVLR